jgi:glycine betaine/proline transport system permease protein
VNQTIMMALSMVVVASMIGAGGLGEYVLSGIQRLDIGIGFEGGLGVVLLAIVLDRLTESFGVKARKTKRVSRAAKAGANGVART